MDVFEAIENIARCIKIPQVQVLERWFRVLIDQINDIKRSDISHAEVKKAILNILALKDPKFLLDLDLPYIPEMKRPKVLADTNI